MNLIQLSNPELGRRVAIVEEPHLILLKEKIASTYQLFTDFINTEASSFQSIINELKTIEKLDYDSIYNFKSPWRIEAPIDCPHDPMHCILSGTGLTHKASAENRNKMHEDEKNNHLTDSMKMYLWGEADGKPEKNKIGVQPEWFFKGNGMNLNGYGQPLVVPRYADDGGEEPEIAGIYLINKKGEPCRLGFVQANEFSDHVMEKKNYLYLAPSKIRNCSIGPELVMNQNFQSIHGQVRIVRDGSTVWEKAIHSGEQAMAHSLANLEYHHFKYQQHRIPGQLHIHFFGAGAFSFGAQVMLKQGDEMIVSFENMGRPLMNPLQIDTSEEKIIEIKSIS
jgi:hypothetical protein